MSEVPASSAGRVAAAGAVVAARALGAFLAVVVVFFAALFRVPARRSPGEPVPVEVGREADVDADFLA
ncbi:hypothetical protein, partial [Desertihabitans aurantiacus]|uniref:hypothetical protein n=1 Tax=Desertihabitans aurantiacus TaxID=2282477 RepID=UPI001300B391